MSLTRDLTRPVRHLTEAVTMPFKALFVVGLCWAINAFTYQGHWWVKWVALGMGIATVVALARGLKTLLMLLLVAWVGRAIWRRWGPAARAQFDDWVARTQPGAAGVLAALRGPAVTQPGAGSGTVH